jgi:transposase
MVLGQREQLGVIEVEVVHRRRFALCPCCNSATRSIHQRHWQKKGDIPLQGRTLILVLQKRRFRCGQCGKVFTEPDEICGWRRRTTERFREELYDQACHQTVKRVAQYYGVGQRLVRESFAHYVKRQMGAAGLTRYTPSFLGIDDFSVRKGRRYQTIFCDVGQRCRLEVVDGRDGDSVRPYLESLSDPEGVQAVAMDMSEAYRSAVQLCLPKADIVADKMHVIGLVNRALDRVRLRVQRARGEENRGPVYEGRHLLLRNREDLDEEDRGKLKKLLRDHPQLRRAWQLKEDFRRWYREADGRGARLELRAWEREVEAAGPSEYRALLVTFGRWREEILNYFRHGITNGYVEGSNNRTKAIQRQAYGYRNNDNLRLRILLPKAA